jgi:hypothetical protein
MLRTLVALPAALALATSALAQGVSPLQQAVSATTSARTPYAFDLEMLSEDRHWRMRFDPRNRLQMVQPTLESLPREERRSFDHMRERFDGVSWCASEEMRRVADVRLLREDAETATYSFQPTRDSIRGDQARDLARHLRGEFTITKTRPDLTQLRIFATRNFSPMLLVTIERLNINVTCAVAPNGRRYAAETVSEVRGSAFGSRFSERSVERAHGLRTP